MKSPSPTVREGTIVADILAGVKLSSCDEATRQAPCYVTHARKPRLALIQPLLSSK